MDKSRAHHVFVIIDGNAVLHRAYHALPPLTNSKGEQINAVYGFISMLLKIVEDLKPSHLVVCFDRPEPTFRKKMYVGYQAKRPKMDDELISQIDMVKKAVSSMNIPVFELIGFEADDVIGTLSKQAKVDQVIIITGDRDILQLVDKKTKVYMPVQGLTKARLYGENEVKEKFGVKPPQIIDYKALAGDASDNYPGVKGVGPKTASALLQKFGTVERVYESLKNGKDGDGLITERLAKALAEEVEEAGMAKKLAKIVRDAPVTLDLEKAKMHDFDNPKSRETFAELEFRTLLSRLTGKRKEKKKSNIKIKQKEENNSEQLSLV